MCPCLHLFSLARKMWRITMRFSTARSTSVWTREFLMMLLRGMCRIIWQYCSRQSNAVSSSCSLALQGDSAVYVSSGWSLSPFLSVQVWVWLSWFRQHHPHHSRYSGLFICWIWLVLTHHILHLLSLRCRSAESHHQAHCSTSNQTYY